MVDSNNQDKTPGGDRLDEVYQERLYSRRVQQALRQRIHWMASRVVGQSVLDVGCSQGTLSMLLAREGFQVLGVDVDERALEYAERLRAAELPEIQQRLQFVRGSVFDQELPPGGFDTVYLGQILEHLANPQRLLELAARCVRPEGRVVITTPFGLLDDPDHRHTFMLRDFVELVSEHFVVRELAVIGKRICFSGALRSSADTTPGDSRFELLRLTEEAFLESERNYLDELRELHARHVAQGKDRETTATALTKTREQFESLQAEERGLRQRLAQAEQAHVRELESLRADAAARLQAAEQAARSAEATSRQRLQEVERELASTKARSEELEHTLADRERELQQRCRDLEARTARLDELEVQLGRLAETEALVAQKDRYIQHLKQQLLASQRHAKGAHFEAQKHLLSVRYRLGDALLRAARPSRDTLALPLRLAQLVTLGLRHKARRGELPEGALWDRMWSLLRFEVRRKRARNREPQVLAPVAGPSLGEDRSRCAPSGPARPSARPLAEIKRDLDLSNWHRLERPADVKVCSVLDEFSAACFQPEGRFFQPRPDNWESAVAYEHPDLLLVESAWKGNEGSWQYRVAKYTNPPGRELVDLVSWFRSNGRPAVFWNKEDPVHFDQFLESAKLFDVVLTSDADRIDAYRQLAGVRRVAALPFAAQPRLHNPIHAGRERLVRSCFAGSYYANRFSERRAEMEMLLDAAIPPGLDIFDRNFGATGPGSEHFLFPERFRPHVIGRLPYSEVIATYKGYRVFLNVNSVIDSPTMFSRRVYELMACGTPVVSTWCRGIEELLGTEAVCLVRNAAEAREAIERLLHDDREWNRRSLVGIRQVFGAHTYRHRFAALLAEAGMDLGGSAEPDVWLLAEVDSADSLQRVLAAWRRQSYPQTHLVPVWRGAEPAPGIDPDARLHLLDRPPDPAASLRELSERSAAALFGVLRLDAVYGTHFVEDLVRAWEYSGASVVGKAAAENQSYRYTQPLTAGGTLFDGRSFARLWAQPADLLTRSDPGDWQAAGATSFAADAFGFTPLPEWRDEAQSRRAEECCEP